MTLAFTSLLTLAPGKCTRSRGCILRKPCFVELAASDDRERSACRRRRVSRFPSAGGAGRRKSLQGPAWILPGH